MKRIVFPLVLFLSGLLILQPGSAMAEKFPSKDITLICPWSAGGGTDTVARALAKNAKKYLGVNVNVVNKTGGGGVVGQTAVAQARKDGYTVGLLADPNHSYMLQGKTKFGFYQGLDPLCMVNWSMTACSVRSDDKRFPDFKTFVEAAKANPGQLTCAISGPGGPWHLTMAVFAKKNELEFTWVPFGGAAKSRTAMIGGHTDFTVTGIDEMLPFYQSKQANIIAYFGPERHPAFSDVPTATELGFPLVSGTFRLITLPEGAPAEKKEVLLKGFEGCFNDPEFKALMDKLGLVPYWKAGDDLKKVIVDADANLKIGLKAIGLME
jgi:tripartite-type tricarboxylate transporter receptor subunit TctC